MDEERFNMEIRKFLKKVGVTSQREIESAVRAAVKSGKISGDEKLKTQMRLRIDQVEIDLVIDGSIALE